MKFVLYFMGEAYGIPKYRESDCVSIAMKVRDTYNCNVELVLYGNKHVHVWPFKKKETYYPYSRERLERNGKVY